MRVLPLIKIHKHKKMKKLKTVQIIGIILLIITIVLIFINDIVENDFLKMLAENKQIFAIFGGVFLGYGFFLKQKTKMSDKT